MDAFIFRKITFSDLFLNGQQVTLISEGDVNRCEIYDNLGRYYWALTLTEDVTVQIDIQKYLAKVKYSKWIEEPDAAPIIDIDITLPSIPPWLSIYSSAAKGCIHRIAATFKLMDSQGNYENFTHVLRSIMPKGKWKALEKEEAILLWNERCAPMRVIYVKLCFHCADIIHSANRIIKSVAFKPSLFPNFSPTDLERLKNDDRWLSDTHVTLSLLDCFQECAQCNIWGKSKIKLLDTTFWQKLTEDPNRYKDGFKRKNNLLECDFAVVPMFLSNHWRLGIIENPAEFLKGKTNASSATEGNRLQKILLKHCKGKTFTEGRIATNHAQVPIQANLKDCGCFTVYFAKKFFLSPDSTVALIKTKFPSMEDRMLAWGLKNSNMTFVRCEIASLLYKYVDMGDAVVEYH